MNPTDGAWPLVLSKAKASSPPPVVQPGLEALLKSKTVLGGAGDEGGSGVGGGGPGGGEGGEGGGGGGGGGGGADPQLTVTCATAASPL